MKEKYGKENNADSGKVSRHSGKVLLTDLSKASAMTGVSTVVISDNLFRKLKSIFIQHKKIVKREIVQGQQLSNIFEFTSL